MKIAVVQAAAAPPVVRLRGVAKSFARGAVAVSGVDLDVQSGAFVSLLGPSGCGKTTVLRMIAGLTEPSAGTLDVPGGAATAAGEIGFVFQEPTLMPWASALANVVLPLSLAGVPRAIARERAMAALKRVGLAGHEHAFPRELSGGMKMRVSIARATVTAPRLLLMDEPFAALDEFTRFRLNDDLLALWQAERFTVIFVTHSVFESAYLSQRVLLMGASPGRIVDQIAIDAPHPRTAAFRTSPLYGQICRSISERLTAVRQR